MNKNIIIIIVCVLVSILILLLISPMAIDKINLKKVKGDSVSDLSNSLKLVKLPIKKPNYSEPFINAKANLLIDIDSFYVLHEDKAGSSS